MEKIQEKMQLRSSLYKKLQMAKKDISLDAKKKEGNNTMFKYNYFMPEEVERICFSACSVHGIFYQFQLGENEASIIFTDIDTGYQIKHKEHIKLVNEDVKGKSREQVVGTSMTYYKRYLLQNFFGFCENDLDPDSDKQTGIRQDNKAISKSQPAQPAQPEQPARQNFTEEMFNNMVSHYAKLSDDEVKLQLSQISSKRVASNENASKMLGILHELELLKEASPISLSKIQIYRDFINSIKSNG